jgi:hypothetical protein
MATSRRTARIVAIAIGVPVLVLALLIAGLTYALGGFRDNVAQDALTPVTKSIEATGATLICDQGDAGYGPDNVQPWYKAFYEVPDNAPGRQAFFAAAAANGFPMKPDTAVRGQSEHQRFWVSEISDAQLGITLVIHRDTTVTPDCASSSNQPEHTSGAGAIYEIEFVSPPRAMP